MRTVAIIQARMGSSRLPGKVLADIGGRTMLARVLDRVSKARGLSEVVVATTTGSADDDIVGECDHRGIAVWRGEEDDVLDRYYHAAKAFCADAVVRITADCPLIDPEVIENLVDRFDQDRPDYASNTLVRSYPRGLDVEVIDLAAIEKAWTEAKRTYERVHVTPYIHQNPQLFTLLSVVGAEDCSRYRWTVDVPADLDLVRCIYAALGTERDFGWQDVLSMVIADPSKFDHNRNVRQKDLKER